MIAGDAPLHLDHIGPVLGQQQDTQGSGDPFRQIENTDPVEGPRRHPPSPDCPGSGDTGSGDTVDDRASGPETLMASSLAPR